MKRHGDLYHRIYSIENLQVADMIARKGKAGQYGIQVHDRNREANIERLHIMLKTKKYRTSPYTVFQVFEPKERTVYRLPYYPDRIVHHAIMNVLEPVFVSTFTADTYSCIKGRGIHAAAQKVRKALVDQESTKYCLKFDIRKFYPSIDHRILKSLVRRKIKDADLLWLLDEIIDSADGLPIGNYLSQFLANYYLTFFDHWVKEYLRVKYYFRYADDIVILAGSKEYLHDLFIKITDYLADQLSLAIKGNYQVFPVAKRGIDFLGYVFFHTHTRLRKTIKKRFARMLRNRPNLLSVASYYGWACHADCKHLFKTLSLYEKVRRLQYQSTIRNIHRRQDQSRPDIEQNHYCREVQN